MTIQLEKTSETSTVQKLFVQKEGARKREIGELDSRTLTVHRNPKLHLLRKWNAYGFNHELMNDDRFFDVIIIEEPENKRYIVSREDIMRYGRVYQAPEFEKQIFISLDTLREISAG